MNQMKEQLEERKPRLGLRRQPNFGGILRVMTEFLQKRVDEEKAAAALKAQEEGTEDQEPEAEAQEAEQSKTKAKGKAKAKAKGKAKAKPKASKSMDPQKERKNVSTAGSSKKNAPPKEVALAHPSSKVFNHLFSAMLSSPAAVSSSLMTNTCPCFVRRGARLGPSTNPTIEGGDAEVAVLRYLLIILLVAVIALADCLALAAVLVRHAILALGTLPLEGFVPVIAAKTTVLVIIVG
ncbi:hypothetical protein AK812_SmicGene4101 [Symbiodinium microadriaticum]|uniref:Uncharacterized protein n=1 Tax=Symbiodinium microadriaticum TaxID=2951 RepID=A0A1Q9EX58_SYMMI|nr:hypothetical protein AK812_SmicGene4101 [Symbiodinium microadriaticum]